MRRRGTPHPRSNVKVVADSAEAAQGASALSRSVQGVTDTIAETRRSAAEVAGASRTLGAQADTVRTAVRHFIDAVRAA